MIFVLFITAILLLIILRVVRTDLAKYLRIPDEELTVTGKEILLLFEQEFSMGASEKELFWFL